MSQELAHRILEWVLLAYALRRKSETDRRQRTDRTTGVHKTPCESPGSKSRLHNQTDL